MKVRICSDLHTEFYQYRSHPDRYKNEFNTEMMIPHLDTDKDSILILAGDITMARNIENYLLFFEDLSERFFKVLYVMGNHEHYKFNYRNTESKIFKFLLDNGLDGRVGQGNIYLLENSGYGSYGPVSPQSPLGEKEAVHFYGCTLWTDFDKSNPIAMEYAKHSMSDFYVIEYNAEDGTGGHSHWTPELSTVVHGDSLKWLDTCMSGQVGKKVVITHHAPSYESVSFKYRGNSLNPAFYSNLEAFVLKHQPDLWIHGHVHQPFDYMIGKTRVIANPLGYGIGHENPDYNFNLVIDI